jgi:hypothetical protein
MISCITYHRLCPRRDDIPHRHFAVLCCHPAVERCTAMFSMHRLCTGKLLNGDSIRWLTSELMDVLQTYPCNSHVWKMSSLSCQRSHSVRSCHHCWDITITGLPLATYSPQLIKPQSQVTGRAFIRSPLLKILFFFWCPSVDCTCP